MAKKKNSRGAQGSGNIRKKTITRNGKSYTYWEARVTIGRDPGTGKQLQKSFTGKTQKEVREKMQAAAVEINDGTYLEPAKLTVGQWVDIWKREYLGHLKPRSFEVYEMHIETYIKPALGAIKLEALTPHAVQTFCNSLVRKSPDDKNKISPATLKITHAILNSSLDKAVRLGNLRSNPAAYCTLPRSEKKEIHPLDEIQTKAFLDEIKGHPMEVLFTVDLFTGMREGEILGLTWDCVNFENGTITINKQLQKNPKTKQRELTTTKTGKTRTITPAP